MSVLSSSGAMNNIGSLFGLISGIGQFFGAKEENAAGDYNASLFENQAVAERQSQSLLEAQKRRITKATIGSQIATAGAQGFRFSGDPITIMMDSMANSEMDIAIDKYNAEVRARGLQNQANLERYEARKRATGSYLDASSSFLSTAASTFLKNRTLGGGKGTNLGPGTTSYGVKVPARYVYQ